MPIYEFKCNTCFDVFEELVPMKTEGERLVCPSCGEVGARRLVSAFAAHGLENGHIAVGRKFTGKSSGGESSEGAAAPAADTASATAAATATATATATAPAAQTRAASSGGPG